MMVAFDWHLTVYKYLNIFTGNNKSSFNFFTTDGFELKKFGYTSQIEEMSMALSKHLSAVLLPVILYLEVLVVQLIEHIANK